MDRATAKARLINMVAATSRPVLSSGVAPSDIETLLDMVRLPDNQGRLIGDTGYVEENWDLNSAAAEGWRWKAAKVAGDFTFSADGASYSKADVLAHCLEMEQTYLAKVTGTSLVRGASGLGYDTSELIP